MSRLESPTRSLEMTASQEILIQSRAGSIEATSLNDLKLNSFSGSVSYLNWIFPNKLTLIYFIRLYTHLR